MGYQGAERTYPHESTRSECCSVSSIRLENYHIFSRGLAKNTFTICNVRRQKPRDPTNVRKSFYKRTTLTGVLHRRIRNMSQLFLFMRLSKQLDQIFQLVDQLYDDESDPVGVAVDGVWGYARDTASGFEFGLGPDPFLAQSHDVGHELPDTMCVVILYRVLIDYNLEFPVQNRISDECRNAVVSKLLHLCKDIQFFFIREADLPAISDFCFYLCNSQ